MLGSGTVENVGKWRTPWHRGNVLNGVQVVKVCLHVCRQDWALRHNLCWLLDVSVVKKLRYWQWLPLDRADGLAVQRECLFVIWHGVYCWEYLVGLGLWSQYWYECF